MGDMKFAAGVFRRSQDIRHRKQQQRRQAGQKPPPAWDFTDLVLVTAWGRPEFLLATLEHLIAAEAVQEHKFIFLLDDEYDTRMLCIIEAWPRFRGKSIVRTSRHDWMSSGNWGNTFNTLEGYRHAEMMAYGSRVHRAWLPSDGVKARPSRLVYLVEEDIFVARDFFLFHRAVQGGQVAGLGPAVDSSHWSQIHSVIAHNLDIVGTPQMLDMCLEALAHPNSTAAAIASRMLYSRQHFASLGISMDYRNLSLITQHAKHAYYTALIQYIKKQFPNAERKPYMAPEQDGLIDREYNER